MFIRFVVGHDGEDHRQLTGVFTEARILRDAGHLSSDEDLVLEAYEWFNEHLPVPPFSSSRWPKDAVAWFRDDAGECLDYVWRLVALLREHGKTRLSSRSGATCSRPTRRRSW